MSYVYSALIFMSCVCLRLTMGTINMFHVVYVVTTYIACVKVTQWNIYSNQGYNLDE